MSRWRIVQVKPEGLPQAYIIEEFVTFPATKKVNEKYKYHQSYYENQCKLNAGARPQDWWVITPTSQKWQDKGQWYYRDTKEQAELAIKELQTLVELNDQLKTFKRVVVQEYD